MGHPICSAITTTKASARAKDDDGAGTSTSTHRNGWARRFYNKAHAGIIKAKAATRLHRRGPKSVSARRCSPCVQTLTHTHTQRALIRCTHCCGNQFKQSALLQAEPFLFTTDFLCSRFHSTLSRRYVRGARAVAQDELPFHSWLQQLGIRDDGTAMAFHVSLYVACLHSIPLFAPSLRLICHTMSSFVQCTARALHSCLTLPFLSLCVVRARVSARLRRGHSEHLFPTFSYV